MQSFADFKYVEGCVPCTFVCSCCERNCIGVDLYIWENKYTQEIYSILCGHCYRGCPQGLGRPCLLLDENN
jgi:hypothetical protein